MTMKIVFAALAIAAGVAAAMQGATNAGLSKVTGLGRARVVNTVVPLGAVLVLLDPVIPVPFTLTAVIMALVVVVLVLRPPLPSETAPA